MYRNQFSVKNAVAFSVPVRLFLGQTEEYGIVRAWHSIEQLPRHAHMGLRWTREAA
jgi:hypothetical protein